MSMTLQDIASNLGIKLKSYRPGHTENGLICPQCRGGRTKEKSLNVTINADGGGLVFLCHRGSCGHTGGKFVSDRPEPRQQPESRSYKTPKPHPVTERPIEIYDWFEARGISWDTVDWFQVYLMPDCMFRDTAMDAIVFPYFFEAKVVNRKYRGIKDKRLMKQEFEPLPTLFNVDSIKADDELIFCEGECDVMALHEAGFRQIVSLKDGADKRMKDRADQDDKRFLALKTHSDLLAPIKKIILAGDMDEPGCVLREELARRFGRQRCWIVTWPDDCKDANDTLVKHGKIKVVQCVEEATPYPIEGVQEVNPDRLLQYLKLPPVPVMTTGVHTVDQTLKFPSEGRLIVVTGLPNAGKSTVLLNWMIHLMRAHSRKWLVFSPEMQPVDEFIIQCVQVLVGRPIAQISEVEQRRAADWLKTKLFFLASDSEDDPPTLDMILERGRECVMRHGVTDILIDPINELEQSRGSMTETEYIGRMLQRARSFSNRHGCNNWIVAHPAKMKPAKVGEPLPPPGPYDINGSAHWANKADLGITIHTPADETEVYVWKARWWRWGRKGSKSIMHYDRTTCRYYAPEVEGSQSAFIRQFGEND